MSRKEPQGGLGLTIAYRMLLVTLIGLAIVLAVCLFGIVSNLFLSIFHDYAPNELSDKLMFFIMPALGASALGGVIYFVLFAPIKNKLESSDE